MGSRPLAQLLPPAQRAELTQLRAQCEAEGLADGSSVLAPCRACGHQTLVCASECEQCGVKVHVCCASHRVLQSDDFSWCRLCFCLFSPEVAPLGSNCPVCGTGVVIPGG
ncbi:hypothetical protein T492DRAFT_835001 [Pavlovales sp. CCMP2436]|nr:hypothetical protein T492DRAFT_835001 [Pavlovales sp. CCMP2436]